MSGTAWTLSPDRCFDPEPSRRAVARALYATVRDLPLLCPHGHVPPALLADPEARLGTPAELLIIPDHYVTRMLYSQGVPLESLGVPSRDGAPVEADHRTIWQRFAERFQLFHGTPTGLWLRAELIELFGVEERLDGASAGRIYDQIEAQLARPEFRPRALLERFRIELLATTDAATDPLEQHRKLHATGLTHIRPTFRPDAAVAIDAPGWRAEIERLGALAGVEVLDYASYIRALEQRRAFFKQQGALATDHAALTPYTARLSDGEAEALFALALRGAASEQDAARFTAHMLMEFARMSCEDGLVMQLHAGSLRNHNQALHARFGPDVGADIPVASEWTRNLRPLLNAYGADPRLRLILFTLDESAYGRELAPLAGHYPAVLLGPPWWFFDSVNGMRRYFDQVVETAGLYNTAGFNDDTRAFASIPARHDVWRRVSCDWLAGQVAQGLIAEDEAAELAYELAYGLARRAYKLDRESEDRAAGRPAEFRSTANMLPTDLLQRLFGLDGQVAIVTGGTGVLGGVMARGLARAGARVGVLGRRREQAEAVAQEIRAEGGEALALVADVLDRAQLDAAKAEVLERWGRLDILVNAAGGNMPAATLAPGHSFFELPVEGMEPVIALNLQGTLLPSQVFGAAMAAGGRGSIVNISSMAAQRALTRVVGYSVAKAAVENATRWLAVELARSWGAGLRVNAIAPGFFVGDQNRALLLNEDGSLTPRGQLIVDHTPAGRFGSPDELVSTLVWLCSPGASFVNGVVVAVDGGFGAFSGV